MKSSFGQNKVGLTVGWKCVGNALKMGAGFASPGASWLNVLVA
jgi:hypothetical protein